MSTRLNRRTVLVRAGLGAGAVLALPAAPALGRQPAASTPGVAGALPWPGFPQVDPARVAEIVGAAHRDIDRVRELLDQQPELVHAAWDWGFGDRETALGAAAHTGRRQIAELLIARGARVDVFAAAMLGWTDAVRAMITASPGLERSLGPHGIPLLAHAQAGGEPAAATHAYLSTLPGAGEGLPAQPVSEEERGVYTGAYAVDPGAAPRIEITGDRWLQIQPEGRNAVRLHRVDGHEFYPAGAYRTRVLFEVDGPRAVRLTIRSGPNVVRAARL